MRSARRSRWAGCSLYSGKDTEVYGAGAYLMAGSELRKYVIGRDHPRKKTVTVTNPLGRFRPAETVSVPWPSGGSGDAAGLRVFDVRHGRVIPHQLADTDGDGTTFVPEQFPSRDDP